MGMIGGGKNAFIGAVHRIAANMDGLTELVCGAFSSHPDTARESGRLLFIPEDRTYLSYEDMIERDYMVSQRVRIALQGHAPFAAATQAVYETLKALRDGQPAKSLKGLASSELTGRVTREADVKARSAASNRSPPATRVRSR